MSRLSFYVAKNSTTQIGETITILTGNSNATPLGNVQISGDFVECGFAYQQNTYPALYQQLGKIKAAVFDIRISTNTAGTIFTVTYGNGTYLFGGINSNLATSTDGYTWVDRTSNIVNNVTAAAYGNGRLVIGGTTTPTFAYSSDNGVSWANVSISGSPLEVFGMAYGNNIWVGGGTLGRIYRSTDGITWTTTTTATGTNGMRGLVYAANLWVAGGFNGAVYTSPNANGVWTQRGAPGGSNIIQAMAFGNNVFLYGAETGNMGTSTDGITWTTRTSNTTATIFTVAYGNGLFAYGTSTGNVFTSSDNGANWIQRTTNTTNPIRSLIYVNDQWIYGDGLGQIGIANNITSSDKANFYGATYDSTQFYVPTYLGRLNPNAAVISAVYSNVDYTSYMRGR